MTDMKAGMAVCPKCHESCADGLVTCEHCGTSLPGALERLIDDRAHAILAEEKAANARIEEQAIQKAADEKVLMELGKECKAAFDAYTDNMTEPATIIGSVFRSMVIIAIVTFVLGILPFVGGMTTAFLFPAIGFTPSSVACPYVCDECEASAHVVRSRSGKSHVFFCKNQTVDVTKVGYDDIYQKRLKPYALSGDVPYAHFGGFTESVIDALVITPCIALFLGPIMGIRRRRRRLAERSDLKAKLDDLNERIRLLDAAAPPTAVYR